MKEKLKKSKLFLMSGVPGSGKSTWAINHINFLKGTTKYVSRDRIRFNIITKEEGYFSHEKEVYRTFVNEIKDGLKNYDNVIADASHLNVSSRKKLFNSLGKALKDVEVNIVVMDTCLAKSIEQNNLRKGRALVPESVIRNMAASFEMPTLEEGFDNICVYRKIGNKVTYEITRKEINE